MKFAFKILFIFFFILLFWLTDYSFEKKQFTFKKLKTFLSPELIQSLKNVYTNNIDINFSKTYEEKIRLRNKDIKYTKYSNKIIKNRYYLEQTKDKILFVTPAGSLFFLNKDQLSQKKKELVKIRSNFRDLVGKDYIKNQKLVVKEILIIEDKIFISYLHNNSECYSNAILKGDLNFNFIKFSNFVKLDECKKRFNYAVGGNIKKFGSEQILFTIGDYNSYEDLNVKIYDDPQNLGSLYGKILSINLKTKKIDIVSMGHRNPQGLFYDLNENIIYSTEHGPQGGDEININFEPNLNEIENYGWAISSYGEHYGSEDNFSEKLKDNPELYKENESYKRAPLYKSHNFYGFKEPFKFFTPSIGITEILKVKSKDVGKYKLLVASMGDFKEEGDLSMHIVELNENFKEMRYDRIFIGERIRDIIDLGDGSIFMSLESTGSFGILENIY